MRFAEVNVLGVLISPMVPMIAIAFVILLLLRRVLLATGSFRWIWHPALFDFSAYLIILSLIVLISGQWTGHG